MTADWQHNILEDPASITGVLADAKRVAVLGIKTEQQGGQPAFFVAEYLDRVGYDVVPVPVYYPQVTEILGKPVHRRLADVPEPLDLVVVFRRSADVPTHVDDLLQARPGSVWMQSGIRSAEAARRLAEGGVRVVQDRCTMIEHRRMRIS